VESLHLVVMRLGQAGFKHGTGGLKGYSYTDIKENQIFLIHKEIQSGAVANSYMRTGFLIYEEMRKYFPIYEEAVKSWMTLQLLQSEFPYI
jgi:hypothetical protein